MKTKLLVFIIALLFILSGCKNAAPIENSSYIISSPSDSSSGVAVNELKKVYKDESYSNSLIQINYPQFQTQQGICYSYEMTQKAADLDYQLAKTERTDGAYERYISEELEQNNMTEEEYLSLLYDYSYDNYNYYRLKSIFAEDLYNETSPKSLDEQFDQYVEHLVETADVEIFTTQSNV